ncbi:putative protein FAM172B isoform X1 [Gopherus flavomarginatus]|uniref:putative protein FAM172B isoform X1 n=1 Tax=Gopherus flavomarginatus TaxID=286002 RepID=UPI0021CC13B1|nr:putative protein FAM172B isoform X1 [Gopherus flavomarginatus]XP_050816274.1 putative protein FAM172B isoform X1 [Gopherus flavomarginatus]
MEQNPKTELNEITISPSQCPKVNVDVLQMEQELSFRKLVESSECPEQLKYDFNKNGELKHLDTNEPFVFNYYKNAHESNHKRYQVLGHLITQYVYELLERVCKLQKVHIPTDATEDEPRSFFFISEKALTNSSSLIVLLQDRGVFRAGQWGLKTIIHEGLDHGTQIPFIKTALQCYGGVIVLNPNDNFIDLKMEDEWLSLSTKEESSTVNSSWWIPKRCSSSSEEHTIYIWDNFISKSAAKNVAFIAHGYGGLVFINLLIQRTWEVMNKVYSVALIDSMHHTLHQVKNNPQVQEWIQKHCREWVTNSKPLDRPTGSLVKVDCPTVSAGTEKYSLAPSSTLQAIFKYLKSTLKAKNTVTLSRSPIVTRSSKNKKRGNTC